MQNNFLNTLPLSKNVIEILSVVDSNLLDFQNSNKHNMDDTLLEAKQFLNVVDTFVHGIVEKEDIKPLYEIWKSNPKHISKLYNLSNNISNHLLIVKSDSNPCGYLMSHLLISMSLQDELKNMTDSNVLELLDVANAMQIMENKFFKTLNDDFDTKLQFSVLDYDFNSKVIDYQIHVNGKNNELSSVLNITHDSIREVLSYISGNINTILFEDIGLYNSELNNGRGFVEMQEPQNVYDYSANLIKHDLFVNIATTILEHELFKNNELIKNDFLHTAKFNYNNDNQEFSIKFETKNHNFSFVTQISHDNNAMNLLNQSLTDFAKNKLKIKNNSLTI